jgi:predicted NBD/HSP70 family sugar kinase
MKSFKYSVEPKIISEMDPNFRPIYLANANYLKAVMKSKNPEPVAIAIERNQGIQSVYKTFVFNDSENEYESNIFYIERLIKSLLWIKGGWKIIFGGPKSIGNYIKESYAVGGLREFDREFMTRIYEKKFTVELTTPDMIKDSNEKSAPLGRHLEGYRIGFDAGGSDRKVSAVVDGVPIYSEEVVWHPKLQTDPTYHYQGILDSIKTAASKMPRVDAIGVSSAGVYIDNRVMAASLFIKVPKHEFDLHVKDMFINIAKELGDIPIEVANDGDVTALAGAMSLESNQVLGIAMGTSQAAGYVDAKGNITGWLNELAFVPADYNPDAMIDEWSLDYGCGVKYFSQDAAIKLAEQNQIKINPDLSPAEKLEYLQNEISKGNEKILKIFDTIGIYLGYNILGYQAFYDIKHVLVLGRVTSGLGGSRIIHYAKLVLEAESPDLAKRIKITLPDEKSRRVGQSVAAASLPDLNKRY